MSAIPFELINTAALSSLPALLAEWFPAGRLRGREFQVGNLRGDPGQSFRVNITTGEWAEFGEGFPAKGGDPVSLYAAKFTDDDQGAAARALGQQLGVYTNGSGRANAAPSEPGAQADKTRRRWQPIVPPPADAPAPMRRAFDGYDQVYDYLDPMGQLLFYVRRREGRNDRQKVFHPLTYGVLDGAAGWHMRHPAAPLPLYGLHVLAVRPDASVIVCEGEKAAIAAASLFADHVCVCWPGGAKAVDKCDWRPLAGRDVIVWPDNDVPGHQAAAQIAALLPGTYTLRVDDLAAGADAADVTPANPEAWLRDRLEPSSCGNRTTAEHPDMLDHPDMSVLRLNRRPPPILPTEVFGLHWAAWIAATAAASACPPDYVAAPLLSIASALIGNARWAEAWPGWNEPPHLWACTVGDSGSGKSPGADVLLRDVLPILERRMSVDHPETLRAWVTASETDKAAREVWEAEVRMAHKTHLAPPMPPEAAAQQKPEIPRLRQNDVTIEKVAALLACAAPKGLMVVRDELLGWVAGMNAYHDAGRAFWIEAYGGRPYRVERQKHPEPIDVPRLVVAVFGGTQPAKVAGLLEDADDGLLGRICWFWPDPVPFAKGKAAPGVAWAVEALDHLRRLDLSLGGGADTCPLLVQLDEPLHGDMEVFGQEMQARQATAGGLMQSAYGKARGLALRLALVLTYLRWAGDGGKGSPPAWIERAEFAAAAQLVADYLMPMAERVYGDAATNKEDRDAATLARWIRKTRPAEVHVRTLQRDMRLPGLNNAAAIHGAAEVLQEAGWLVPPKPGSFQQRARAAYPINPQIFCVMP